ncbi:MAG TPA: hypothetical protein VGS08_03340 [Candidatus Saccharimonadales bacterium]|nr:hypothetical protein [Candidatus Saccharimonadales bacterium]
MSYNIQEFRDVTTYDQLGDLVPGLEACITSAFGGTITEEDARYHMAGQQVLVATMNPSEKMVIGFASASVISPREEFGNPDLTDQEGLYFIGAAIHRAAQGNGLYHGLNSRRLDFGLSAGVDFVYTRTQNPRVQEGITHLLDKRVTAGQIRGYEVGRMVCRGAYGRMLTREKPVARDLCFEDIDYDNGDAAILTWQLSR